MKMDKEEKKEDQDEEEEEKLHPSRRCQLMCGTVTSPTTPHDGLLQVVQSTRGGP